MARKQVTVESFAGEIQKILEQYGEEVEQNMAQIVDATAQKAAQTLRATSPVNPKGKQAGAYARGWRVEKSTAKSVRGLNVSATVYNTHPQLPHLLEYGHALRQGGRSPAIPHIAPVEDAIFRELDTRLVKL